MLQHKNTGEFVRIVMVDVTDDIVYYQSDTNDTIQKMNRYDFIELYCPIPTYH